MNTIVRYRTQGLLLAALVFAIDVAVKYLVVFQLKLQHKEVIEVLPFFRLTWAPNYGVSLGMLTATSPEMRWLLVAMTSGIALVVLVWMLRERKPADIVPLALVLGGAAGNIRDRVGRGFVIDYADFHIGGFTPFIFNIADAAISIGVVIILARSLFWGEKPETPADRPQAKGGNAAPEN